MSVTAGVAVAVADAVWAEITSAGQASDEHLSILEALFGKNMVRACKILDEGGVRRVSGAPSGRSLFLVMGESKRKEEYICFPEHLCTCYSFFYDIVGRGEQLCCKHQLAARLAEAVSKHQEIEVTDEELAHMLAKL
ncbi:zinc finger SWIM domain-containing protein 7 [Oryza brachyantha]|uniref:zinc finger SWIM domain-containing protein 7 n=1 Tax=Oryza brachyantha TaxID=4533 RepID=UPI0003EA83CA|nr:zinc finger SWIM domain-containing protein 7 [Oryza brachyantha]